MNNSSKKKRLDHDHHAQVLFGGGGLAGVGLDGASGRLGMTGRVAWSLCFLAEGGVIEL